MNTSEKIRAFLLKLQTLPDNKKKIILWTAVAVLAVAMGFFWIRGAVDRFSKIGGELQNIKLPGLDTSDMPRIPSLDILQTTTPSN